MRVNLIERGVMESLTTGYSPKNVPITAYRISESDRFQICPITAYGRRYNPPLLRVPGVNFDPRGAKHVIIFLNFFTTLEFLLLCEG